MRLTTVILIASLMQVSAAGFAQKISLSKSNASLKGVIKELKQQSGYNFVYAEYLLKDAKPVNIDVKDMEFKEVLEQLLDNQPLSYSMDSKTVILRRKEIPSLLSKVKEALGIPIVVTGRVTDSTGLALPGASIKIKDKVIRTDNEGKFSFLAEPGTEVTVSFVGYQSYLFKASPDIGFQNVVLKAITGKLEEVVVSTGYQQLPKERATGSFDYIDNKLLNRSVSTDILSRINGVASGVLFNVNKTGNDPAISVRGRSTINANTDPLIVLDNFPYNGDLTNINPNDVESITILKDAAAASIWGVRAGNGVIVITSKKGKYNQAPKISFNTNLTLSPKPDLYSVPQMTSAEFIEVEKYLFNNGYYDLNLQYNPAQFQSLVVDILEKRRNGLITAQDSAAQLGVLSQIDNRQQLSKYLYRMAANQQYSLNVNGGGEHHQYYISTGYDKNQSSTIPNSNDRITLNAKNNFEFFNNKLNISTGLLYTKTKATSSDGYVPSYPYELLADKNGNALPAYRDVRQGVKDTIGQGHLLNWNYYPLNEINAITNTLNSSEIKLNADARYSILKSLNFQLSYQYTKGNSLRVNQHGADSYYVRNLVNTYSEIDYSTGAVTRPIPLGDILTNNDANYSVNNTRAQLNYSWDSHFGKLTALAGTELSKFNSTYHSSTIFGYDPETGAFSNIDLVNQYPNIINGGTNILPVGTPSIGYTNDNVISYYGNLAYNFLDRFTISGSVRKDESNIFGVRANQKGVPLWSAGFSWDISREKWLANIDGLPDLKFRFTNGYSGNVFKSLSAYTTISIPGIVQTYNAPFANLVNPPNPSLRWEKVHTLNWGLDFYAKNKVLSGSIDYFTKNGTNLIGKSAIAPQTGISQFTGNNSALFTKGLDVSLSSLNVNRQLVWRTTLNMSYVTDKITQYDTQSGSTSLYISRNYTNPIVGKPYSSIFAYPSPGLDKNGNPQGYLNGQLSEDYTAITNSSDLSNLKYMGPAAPRFFGNLLNTISYKGFETSFNIIYKGGYYFQRGSYTLNLGYQQADYSTRWQKPGDELHTFVPSIVYPDDGVRDVFYGGTEQLVIKGDNVKLQDIQVSYSLSNSLLRRLPFSAFKLYFYANNLNYILWRANKLGLDPDFVSQGAYAIKTPITYSFGIKADIK